MRKTNRVLSLILAVAMVIGLVPMMTISSSAAFSDTTLKFDEKGEFTVIQLTDIQDDAEVEALTLATITKAMDRYEPDLVVFTGDNIAGKMNESDFKSSVDQFLAPIINKGVRYAVTFGNHDQERSTLVSTPSNDAQYNYYVSKSNLAVDFDEDSLNGTGTGAIPIYSYDERYVQFCIFPFDSGDYDANGDYDHVEADQNAWYASEANRLAGLSATGQKVPTLAFQHIPVPEIYDNLLQLTNSSTPGAIRGTGQWSSNYYILDPNNPTITGGMREGPCPSAINGGQYQTLVDTGNLVGIFFGHDHTNDFVGTDANGITMGYAQAATLHSYNLGDPAVRVFNIKADGSYTTKNVTYSQMQVEDAEDFEHDVIAGTPTVPEKIFVGAAGNGIAQQKLGNVIQLQSLNYRTQAMRPNDLEITIDLENTVTDVTLTPSSGVEISAPTVTAKDSTTNTYTWRITGGTASAGTYVEYKITYGIGNGETRSQYAYSYVDDIPTPAGYYVFTRNYRSNNRESNFNTQTYVMTVLGDNVYGDTRATSDSDFKSEYDGESIGSWTNAPVGYYNYNSSDDGGFQSMGDTNYGLSFLSPARVRAHYNFPRFMEAGKSPVATIYADKSEVSTLNEMDIYVNYWRHMAPNNGITTTMQLHFKNGDSSYTKDNLLENTAGTASISANQTNVTLANAAGSNAGFKINGTLPATGTEYTMISHGYSFWDNGYATDHNTYLPVLLRFEVYDKADLRALVNAERTEMRQTEDESYRNAFANAYKVLQKTNTTQTEIDGAKLVLNSAIEALTFTGVDISNNAQYAGTATVAPVIYVAGDGYGPSQQPTGNKILSGVLNYASGELNNQYSKFTFRVPQGATNASVSAVTSSGSTVPLDWISAEGLLEGTVTGGTAYVGDYIKYTFEYTMNGQTYYQYESSAVLNAPQASGWLTLIKRNNRFNGIIRSIVESSVIFGDIGSLPAGGYYTGKDIYSGTNYGVNLDTASNNNYVGWGSQQVTGTGVNRWIYSADRFYNDWICGDTGDPKNQKGTAAENDVWEYPNDLDLGHRAGFDIIMDTSVLSNVSQLGMGIKYISLQNDTPNTSLGKLEITSNQGFFPGKVGFATCVANTAGTTSALYLDTPVNNNGVTNDWDYGVKASNDLYIVRTLMSSGLPAAGDYTYWTEVKNSSGNDIFAHMMWNINISYVNKAALRNLVAKEDEMFRQLADGYSDANGKWTAYVNALLKAKATVDDVTINDAATADIQAELNTAIAELEYLPANYDEVRAKIDEVRIQHADNSYSYRPNKNMDPTYYATGEYYPWNNFSSTNEVDIPIDNINWDLDIRYQNVVDGYVDAIDIGWYNVTLASANYTVVDRYLGYKNGIGENGAAGGSGIKLPAKYDYLMHLEFVPAEMYTTDSYQAWTDACAAGMANRTLKAPDQAEVDGYAAALETAYNNLTLNSADYSELDILVSEINQNINENVEVVDPEDSANNYTIPYYSPAYVAELQAKMSDYNANLNVLEQEEVDKLVVELDELYARIGENLNDADYTFAYEQQAKKATYEDEYEKYYTTDSWKALTDARAAIKKGKLAGEQSVVNGYAKAIYDARNNLQYNDADYSRVAAEKAKYDELVANKDWYTNWAAYEAAYNAVVEGKNITEQAAVDKMADDLYAAWAALEKKLADYSELKAALAAAEAKIENQMFYTVETYSVFYAEYLEAKEFNAKPALTIDQQATVNGYTAELVAATNALAWKPADVTPVRTALDSYYEVTGNYDFASEYPTDTDEDGIVDILEAVTAAAEAGEAYIAKFEADDGSIDIRNNTEIINAANLINTEIAKLPALYGLVDAAIAEIPEEDIAAGVYTDESVANLRAVVAAVDRTLKIGSQETVDNYAYAIWDAIDLLEEKPIVAVEFNAINGTIIDEERGFIYGLEHDIDIKDLVAGGYIEVVGNGHVEATPVTGKTVLGTGAEVKFINDNTGEVVATYYIVIFGDNNGDGYVDTSDIEDANKYVNWMEDYIYDYDNLTSSPNAFAMDLDKSGAVDTSDFFYIIDYFNWGETQFIKQDYTGQK
ncbi:MAG: metallophosphoesterase [Clostridia bacterium]|nr:metallophosphoesterase [Clostridia bacterium]